MVNTKGYRRGTRYLFSKAFKRNGEQEQWCMCSVRLQACITFFRGGAPVYIHESIQSRRHS